MQTHIRKLTRIIFKTRDGRNQGSHPKGSPKLCQTCQWPCRTAQSSGGTPLLLALVTAAPCPRSNLHTSSFPLPAAAVRARESICINISSWLIWPLDTCTIRECYWIPILSAFHCDTYWKLERTNVRKYFPHHDFSPCSISLILCFKQNLKFKFCCLCWRLTSHANSV